MGGNFPVVHVAGFPWTGWQLSHGLGGNLPVDWVAGFLWTAWQPSPGLGGRHPWNMQWRAPLWIYSPGIGERLSLIQASSASLALVTFSLTTATGFSTA